MEWLNKLPVWAGNIPAWFLAATVIIALIKIWPKMREQGIAERLSIKDGYKDTIKDLEARVEQCHRESRQRERELQDEINTLKLRLSNEALQRIQSEISLVQTLIQIVPDAEQLKNIMAALESRQMRMVRDERARLDSMKAGDKNEGA